MFPLRDDNPHFLRPFATMAIILLNVLSWVFVQGLGMEPALSASVCRYGMVPGDLLRTLPPGSFFPIAPGLVCQLGGTPAWYTLFTSMFMHGGWLHIIGNMWFLWVFGNSVEDAMGHLRFLVFYLICGLAAGGLQLILSTDPAVPMIGASGAIGGVMGAYILLYPRVRVHLLLILGFFVTTITVPAVFMLAYWFILQLIGGFTSIEHQGGGVAFWAHVGGFTTGAALAYLFAIPQLLHRHPFYGWKPAIPDDKWQEDDADDHKWF